MKNELRWTKREKQGELGQDNVRNMYFAEDTVIINIYHNILKITQNHSYFKIYIPDHLCSLIH